jgi:hypothetical protein
MITNSAGSKIGLVVAGVALFWFATVAVTSAIHSDDIARTGWVLLIRAALLLLTAAAAYAFGQKRWVLGVAAVAVIVGLDAATTVVFQIQPEPFTFQAGPVALSILLAGGFLAAVQKHAR